MATKETKKEIAKGLAQELLNYIDAGVISRAEAEEIAEAVYIAARDVNALFRKFGKSEFVDTPDKVGAGYDN